jgi:hypothetical protein
MPVKNILIKPWTALAAPLLEVKPCKQRDKISGAAIPQVKAMMIVMANIK